MSHKQFCFCGIMARTRRSAVAAAKKSPKPSCCKQEGKRPVAAAEQCPKKNSCKRKRTGRVAVPVPVVATETDVQESLERADALNTQNEGHCSFLVPAATKAESQASPRMAAQVWFCELCQGRQETILDQANRKFLLFEPAIEESTGLSKQLETVLQSDQSDRTVASDATAKATGKLLEDDLAKELLKIGDGDGSAKCDVEMRFDAARRGEVCK